MSDIRDRLKNRSISRSELYEISEEMEDLISTKELLDNIEMALDIDTFRETLEYIARNFDL